jgi:hypothetical protein
MNQIADERLMTITDLSMMLGVPVDTPSTAGVIVVKVRRATASAATFAIAAPASRLGWRSRLTAVHHRGSRAWPTSSGVVFSGVTVRAAFESLPDTECAIGTGAESSTAKPRWDW